MQNIAHEHHSFSVPLDNVVSKETGASSRIPIFDGRRRYDLVFREEGIEHIRPSNDYAYAGDAWRCTITLMHEGRRNAALEKYMGAKTSFVDLRLVTADGVAFNARRVAEASDRAAGAYTRTRLWIGAGLLLGVLFCCAGAAVAVFGVSRPILQIAQAMKRLAGGDLSAQIIGVGHRGEIGEMADALAVFKKDATERLATEERLRQSAERLCRSHEMMAHAQRIARCGSVERDFLSGTTQISDENYRVLGVTPENFAPTAEALLALVHREDRLRVEEVLHKANLNKLGARIEFRIIRPDGATRVIDRETHVILDDDGTPARSISTLQDVTEAREAAECQKKLEAELRLAKEEAEALAHALRQSNVDLEHRVEERTSELQAAQDELVKKERFSIMGQVTATVAHELRNPLSAIKNSAFTIKEIAAAGGLPLERPVTRIERSVHRCERIVAELLDYTRTRDLRCQVWNFDEWLGELAAELTPPPGGAINLDFRAGGANVKLDPDRFRRVVINLFDNAVHAMAEANGDPTPRIILRTRAFEHTIEFEIEDNGPGIPPDSLVKVFEPLFSTKNFSTGLGLPTVKQIVEQHAGSIALTSVVGQGTRASIRLPLERRIIAA